MIVFWISLEGSTSRICCWIGCEHEERGTGDDSTVLVLSSRKALPFTEMAVIGVGGWQFRENEQEPGLVMLGLTS